MVDLNIILAFGLILSLTLVFSAYKIISKSLKIRNTFEKSYSLNKDSLNILATHFYEKFFYETGYKDIKIDSLKNLFKEELETQFLKNEILHNIVSKQPSFFVEKMENIAIDQKIITHLKTKKSESDILKQSAKLYSNIAKFVILYYYVERKESQIDLELSEQNFKSDSYQIRVKKDLKGFEKILIEQ